MLKDKLCDFKLIKEARFSADKQMVIMKRG